MAHSFNPRTCEAETDRYLSSRPAWITWQIQAIKDYTWRPCQISHVVFVVVALLLNGGGEELVFLGPERYAMQAHC